MSTRVNCPNCGALYEITEEHLGKKVRCKQCREVFVGGEPQQQEMPVTETVATTPTPEPSSTKIEPPPLPIRVAPPPVPPPLPPRARATTPDEDDEVPPAPFKPTIDPVPHRRKLPTPPPTTSAGLKQAVWLMGGLALMFVILVVMIPVIGFFLWPHVTTPPVNNQPAPYVVPNPADKTKEVFVPKGNLPK
jgi:predicted Zn finger-like uncharacterized protein